MSPFVPALGLLLCAGERTRAAASLLGVALLPLHLLDRARDGESLGSRERHKGEVVGCCLGVTPPFLRLGAGVTILSLVLLSAAKHSLRLPRKSACHSARWLLTRREKFGNVGAPASFSALLRFSGDSPEL